MNEFKYDAFISYRHTEPDKSVAKKLQRLLESFNPPKSTELLNNRKIRRIFRDESELPTSGDLGTDIKMALEQSRFLIVICSEETQKSPWCMQEISYFKELHGGSCNDILTILVSGEPQKVFPRILCYETRETRSDNGTMISQEVEIEPLAANVSSPTLKEALRKLNTEFLRIAAPILGCGYDDLFKRHQRRLIKRIIGTAAAVVVILAAFSVYAVTNTALISSQKTQLEKTNNELNQKKLQLEDVNRQLLKSNEDLNAQNAETARQKKIAEEQTLVAQQNEKKAIDNLRMALEQKELAISEKTLRTLSAAEELIKSGDKVLASALIYETAQNTPNPSSYLINEFRRLLSQSTYIPANSQYSILHDSDQVNACLFSQDGKTLYTASKDGTVTMWNRENGKEIGKLIHRSSVVALFEDGSLLYSVTQDFTITVWDMGSKTKISERVFPCELSSVPPQIYDVAVIDGKLYLNYQIYGQKENPSGTQYIAEIDMQTNNKKVLTTRKLDQDFKLSYDKYSHLLLVPEKNSIALYDTQKGSNTHVTLDNVVLHKILLMPNAQIAAIVSDTKTFQYRIMIYDSRTMKLLHTIETDINETYITAVAASPSGRFLAVGGYSGRCMVYDLTGKRMSQTIDANYEIVLSATFTSDDKLLLGYSFTGRFINIYQDNGTNFMYHASISAPDAQVADVEHDRDVLAIATYNGSTGLYRLTDSQLVTEPDAVSAKGWIDNYLDAEGVTVNTKLNRKLVIKDNMLQCVELTSGKTIYSYPLAKKKVLIFHPDQQFDYALIRYEGESYFRLLNLKTGHDQDIQELLSYDFMDIQLIDKSLLLGLSRDGSVYQVDLPSGDVIKRNKIDLNVSSISTCVIKPNLGDNTLIVTVIHPRIPEPAVYVYQLSTGRQVMDVDAPNASLFNCFDRNPNKLYIGDEFLGRVERKQIIIPDYERILKMAQAQIEGRTVTSEEKQMLNLY